jgi:hypothetical protein
MSTQVSKPGKGRSYLRNTHPELRAQFVKTIVNNFSFDVLSSHSNLRCIWQCSKTNCEAKCLHTWEATVNARTMRSPPSGCPTCDGLVVCPCNSLGTKYPELLKEYSSEKYISKINEWKQAVLDVFWHFHQINSIYDFLLLKIFKKLRRNFRLLNFII